MAEVAGAAAGCMVCRRVQEQPQQQGVRQGGQGGGFEVRLEQHWQEQQL